MSGIPKTIHWCWLGRPKGATVERCVASWRRVLPDYEIREWNERNFDLHHPYYRAAVAQRRWSKVSNLMRLELLHRYGGLYFDGDVLVLKRFDDLLHHRLFLGFESDGSTGSIFVANGVIGSVAGHAFLGACVDLTLDHFGGRAEFLVSPIATTAVLKNWGLTSYGEQHVRDVTLLPVDRFYPMPIGATDHAPYVTPDSYCVHLWSNSWRNDGRATPAWADAVLTPVRRRLGPVRRLAEARATARITQPSPRSPVDRTLMRYLSRRYLHALGAAMYGRCGGTVQLGPFAGLKLYPWAGPPVVRRILGTYERELHPWLVECIARPYPLVINIGCESGYYAVGLAMTCPAARVVAIDREPAAIDAVRQHARLNDVADRITASVGDRFPDGLHDSGGRALVVCDIQGGERALIDPLRVPFLARCDLLVEIHDGLASREIRDVLHERLRGTHDLRVVAYEGRTSADCPFANGLSAYERLTLVDEERVRGLAWMFCRAKVLQP